GSRGSTGCHRRVREPGGVRSAWRCSNEAWGKAPLYRRGIVGVDPGGTYVNMHRLREIDKDIIRWKLYARSAKEGFSITVRGLSEFPIHPVLRCPSFQLMNDLTKG